MRFLEVIYQALCTLAMTLGGWLPADAGPAFLGGVLGGLVRWMTLRENWREGVACLIVGGISAMFLGPLIIPLLAMFLGKIPDAPQAIGYFATGLSGISLTGMIIDIVRIKRGQLPAVPPETPIAAAAIATATAASDVVETAVDNVAADEAAGAPDAKS